MFKPGVVLWDLKYKCLIKNKKVLPGSFKWKDVSIG